MRTALSDNHEIVDWTEICNQLQDKFVPQGGDVEDLEEPEMLADNTQGSELQADDEIDQDAAEDAADQQIAQMLPGLMAGKQVDGAYLQKKLETRASFDADQEKSAARGKGAPNDGD